MIAAIKVAYRQDDEGLKDLLLGTHLLARS